MGAAAIGAVLVLVVAGGAASASVSPGIFVALSAGGFGQALASAGLDGSNANLNFVTNGPTDGGSGNRITSVTTDGTYLYFTDIDTNTIGRVGVDGSNLNASFITGASEPDGVAVAGGHIYWSNTNNNSNGSIGRADLDGSNVDQSFMTDAGIPWGLAADGSHLYWADIYGGDGTGSVARSDLDGGNVDLSFIVPGSGNYVRGVAVDNAHVYYTEYNFQAIGRANLDGSSRNDSFITSPASALQGPLQVAVGGGHVYWAASASVGRASLDGSGAGEILNVGPYDTAQGVTVLAAPGAPTNVVATPGAGSASVSFDTPDSGGAPITSYTVTSSPGGVTGSGSSSPIIVSGLTNGTEYTFTVTATSSVGDGPASAPSNAVTPSDLPVVTSFSPLKAAAGANVTLVGSALDTVTEVDFTGSAAPATIVSASASKLVVTVPDDAAVGPITVKNGVGQATTAKDFTPIPKITSLSAYDGDANDLVQIIGTNLADASAVKFGTVAASPTPVSATEVDANVPLTGFSSGKVSVTTPGGTATTSQPFAISEIKSFAPASAVAGKTVTITGQGLASATSVDFVGHTGDVSLAGTPTATTVKVVVPDDAAVGDLFVNTANTPHNELTSPKAFKPLPSITGLDPPDGAIGTTVHILGTNFVNVGLVLFGKLAADNVTVVSPTEIDADVPSLFTGGAVTVPTAAGTAVSKTKFTLTKVKGVSPAAAAAGKTVTITGQGLADVTSVDFVGHAGVVPVSTSATSVKVVVPDDALPGVLIVHTPGTSPSPDTTSPKPLKVVPTITNVSPLDGVAGSIVTITGTGFFTDVDTVVKFGSVSLGAYTVMSPTEIDAPIPNGFSSGKITVSTPGGGTAVSKDSVAVTSVTGFAPAKGTAGGVVTITGQGLGSTTGVNFTGLDLGIITLPAPATILSVSPTAVKVAVSPFATVGAITLMTPRATVTTTAEFTPLPKLTALAPDPSQANALVIVSGTNLEPTSVAPTATLGSESLTVGIPSMTSFLTTLPADALTGQTLTVTTPTGTASIKVKIAPTISGDPSPTHGAAGDEVTLSGLTFTGTTKVTFAGGASVPFKVAGALGSTQTLTFKVPPTAQTGAITVTNAGGQAESSFFTVDPVISSFTPTSGPVGTTLTVKGTGFYGATQVTFGGGVPATPTDVTTTSLKVVVPQGVSTGQLVVHTDSAGDSQPSAATFTPTATLSSFSPLGGAVGTAVTIHGAGFTGVTDVKFGSVSVAGFTVAGPTEIDTTVPDGAGDGVITVVRSAAPTSLSSATSFSLLSITSVSPTSVHEGDTLTIHGTHLTDADNVTFGGSVDGTPLVVDDGTITVTVPSGAAGGTVTVHTSGGFGSATSGDSLTILPPEITGITFTSYSTSGSVLQIDGFGFPAITLLELGGIDVGSDITTETAQQVDVVIPTGFAFTSGDSGDVVVHTAAGDTTGSGTFTVYQHANGLGQSYFDGSPPATYAAAEAQAAAAVWADGATVSTVSCSGDSAVQADDGAGDVATWVWDGTGDATLQGHVVVAATPTCPAATDPSWN